MIIQIQNTKTHTTGGGGVEKVMCRGHGPEGRYPGNIKIIGISYRNQGACISTH